VSKVNTPPPHEVRYEREVMELPSPDGWRKRMPTANARASCTCGQLDTGYVDASVAYRAVREHVRVYLPGVDCGPDIEGPARPRSEHCRPGRCMALMCCSYECSQGRCPSAIAAGIIPAEPRGDTR
jgi:hypothetical protein